MAALAAEQLVAEAERSVRVERPVELELDLGNLTALDTNPLAAGAGAWLRSLARDNTQLLVNAVWQLPSERLPEGVVASLPPPSTRMPREKPVPRPRPPTRWEQFAKLKGIRKKKKSGLAWDEGRKEWRRRWGYQRANDETKEWVLEVPDSADPNEDQFAKRVAAKRERVAKNELNRLRNIARAQKSKVPGAGLAPTPQPSKAELGEAIRVARASTASVGKFQEKLPKEQEPRNAGKRRKFEPLIGDFSAERRRQLELLDVISSRKPRLDTTKAANRQLREDDQEQAAKRKKMRPKGGKGGKSHNRNNKGKGQHRKSGMKQLGKRK
ncbi:ribosome biogenesis regulatory protein homolog [Chiloscyllium plagiosum]|uniref:ribosome biogenesis regulatory protein homolog n=1 Tax=Chiloscyllium plagiosum TaxID=36176 RepID=UPI001CB867C5|nr:ribosome biogenesis regulatory protein homolog [Chiloscyllium plagiosum]